MEVKDKITLDELRKLGVEGERKLLLRSYMEKYQKSTVPAEVDNIPKQILFLEVSELYEELLKIEYEKNRLAAYIMASGNFSAYVQYCEDTKDTTSTEYATVVEEIGEQELRQSREEYLDSMKGKLTN